MSRSEYLQAELYQIGYLSQLITEVGDENDVFILIGDHQPFFYTTFEDSRQTPVHIISKNMKLLTLLNKAGFVKGLRTDRVTVGTEHHLIYKTFMNVFYKL